MRREGSAELSSSPLTEFFHVGGPDEGEGLGCGAQGK